MYEKNSNQNLHEPVSDPRTEQRKDQTLGVEDKVHAVTSSQPPKFIPPPAGSVDVLKLLSELEDMVEHSRHGPFGILIGFSEDRFHTIMMKVRANLPEEMKRAAKLVKEMEQLLIEARTSAENIRNDAKKNALSEAERQRAEVEKLKGKTQEDLQQSRKQVEGEMLRLLDQARSDAQRIVEEGQARATHLVNTSEIMQAAQREAQEMRLQTEQDVKRLREQVQKESKAIYDGADDYAAAVLHNLQETLARANAQIERGKEELSKPRDL